MPVRAPKALLSAALGALLLASPATAPAAQVERIFNSSRVGLSAAGGEVNVVTLSHDGSNHIFVDTSATLTAGTGCAQVNANEVSCPSAAGDTPFLFLSDGEDQVTSTTTFPTAVCGGFGDDTIQTGPGLDGIFGEEGNDTLRGGGERGIIFGEDRCSGRPTSVLPGQDTLDGGEGNDILQGGGGTDSLMGGSGGDTLFALEGDDSLDGGGGDDDLLGFEGDDALSGGEGSDRLGGGEGGDSEVGGGGGDVLGVTHVDNGVVHLDEGDDSLDGSGGDDVLNGGPGASFLSFGQPTVDPFESDVPNGAD